LENQFLRRMHVRNNRIKLRNSNTGGRIGPLKPDARAVLDDIRRQNLHDFLRLLTPEHETRV